MGTGAVLWEYHYLENDFSSTSVQIENICSLSKVYTASLLNACTRSHKLETHKTALPILERRIVRRKEREEKRGELGVF